MCRIFVINLIAAPFSPVCSLDAVVQRDFDVFFFIILFAAWRGGCCFHCINVWWFFFSFCCLHCSELSDDIVIDEKCVRGFFCWCEVSCNVEKRPRSNKQRFRLLLSDIKMSNLTRAWEHELSALLNKSSGKKWRQREVSWALATLNLCKMIPLFHLSRVKLESC